MPILLWKKLAICLLLRNVAAAEQDGSASGLGQYILHGLGRVFSGSATADPSMSTPAIAWTATLPPNVPSPTWTVSVPSAHIKWSSDFKSEYVTHAQSCWNAYTSWYAYWPQHVYASSISGGTTTINSTSLASYTTSSTIYPTTSLSTYKLCDGSPRAHYSPSTTVFETTLTEVFSNIITMTSPAIPEPECQPDQNDCAVLYYGTNLTDFPGDSFARIRLYGACGLPLDAGFPCLVQGGPVQLLYFPVSTIGGGLCGPAGKTVTPTTAPRPITTLGTTLFPDSVYISFETLYAAYRPFTGAGGAAAQIGPTFSNTIIGFKSEEISTNCYATWWNRTQTSIPGYGPGTALNFADFNAPVAASAYECQNQCLPYSVDYENGTYTTKTIHPNPCTTILDNFNPLLAVPTRLKEMVPEWNRCKFWSPRQANVIFDPPLALTEAPSEAKPTPPPGYQDPSPSATPPSPPGPTTPIAQSDNLPSQTADPPPKNTDPQMTLPNQPPTSSQQHAPPSHTTIIVGGATITASYPSGATNVAVVNGHLLSAGGPAANIDGHVVTMGPQGLVADDTTTSTTARRPPSSSDHDATGTASTPTASANKGSRDPIPLSSAILIVICTLLASY